METDSICIWDLTAEQTNTTRRDTIQVVHQSLFEPGQPQEPPLDTSGKGGSLTPRACHVDQGRGVARMEVVDGAAGGFEGDSVLRALRAQEAALLRELEQSN